MKYQITYAPGGPGVDAVMLTLGGHITDGKLEKFDLVDLEITPLTGARLASRVEHRASELNQAGRFKVNRTLISNEWPTFSTDCNNWGDSQAVIRVGSDPLVFGFPTTVGHQWLMSYLRHKLMTPELAGENRLDDEMGAKLKAALYATESKPNRAEDPFGYALPTPDLDTMIAWALALGIHELNMGLGWDTPIIRYPAEWFA